MAEKLNGVELAEKFGLSRSTIYVWRHRYEDFPVPDRHGLYDPGVVKAWIEKRGLTPRKKGHVYDFQGRDVTDKCVKRKSR